MQFHNVNENQVVKILTTKNQAALLGNSIALLINRSDDEYFQHACLKLLIGNENNFI